MDEEYIIGVFSDSAKPPLLLKKSLVSAFEAVLGMNSRGLLSTGRSLGIHNLSKQEPDSTLWIAHGPVFFS